MFEKVNPMHPDKVADRIAGAIVDLAYRLTANPHIAVELLVGHGKCACIIETDAPLAAAEVDSIIRRIAGGGTDSDILIEAQDGRLSENQKYTVRCGDNGIFRGMPMSKEERRLARIARRLYARYPTDGKYILDGKKLVICQSNAKAEGIRALYPRAIINPLGFWTGGTDADTGAVNRKLGSDMGAAVTGGGIHGKDLSKADVSVNIYAFLKAQKTKTPVEISCAIGDEVVDGKSYAEIVEIAGNYINELGGFEKLAEWGLL